MLDNMDSDFDDSVDDPDYTSNESNEDSKSEEDTVVKRKAKQQQCHETDHVVRKKTLFPKKRRLTNPEKNTHLFQMSCHP